MDEKEYNKRLLHYAKAKRATAGRITQIQNGKLVTSWAGKLHGDFVRLREEFKKNTKEEALEVARRFRQECIEEAQEKGLL